MQKDINRNIQLGGFVLVSTVLLLVAFYFIGKQQNIFGTTFRISARFYNVNGLVPGNNVRFAGITVGTVKSIQVTSDSTVNVEMVLEEHIRKYIRKTAVASIGTDGLMGNKLVNINSARDHSPVLAEGDTIATLQPIESDEMLRTLNTTNDNIRVITGDLKNITRKISASNSLWSLLMDTVMSDNVKKAIVDIRLTSNRSAIITGDLGDIVQRVKAGKGSLGALITDTAFSERLKQTIVSVNLMSDQVAVITGDLHEIAGKVNHGEGVIGTLLTDTSLVHNLNKSVENIRSGSQGFNENMEALKHNFLFRAYFRKKANQKQAIQKKLHPDSLR